MRHTDIATTLRILAPTTLEMGLTPLLLLHLDSQASSRQEIADLVAARDASDRYSAIQIMSSNELMFSVDTFGQSRMAHDVMFKLRELLNSENSQTIYLRNAKGYHSVLNLA
jgi:hypothetical protein